MVVALLAAPLFSFAVTQEEAFETLRAKYPSIPEEVLRKVPITTGPAIPEAVEPAGNVSCFDYYTFGSVTAEPNGEIKEAVAGSLFEVGIRIQNNNSYPVVDGTLWVKIFRKADDSTQRLVHGDHLVDFFPVVDGVTLASGEAEGYSLTWPIPTDVIPGEYYVATFFTVADAYNLLGLTFTDDIVGETYFFSVLEGTGSPYFDKRTATIAGKPYQFIGAPPVVDRQAPVPVSIEVTNPTDAVATAEVVWNVYRWDALTEKNLRETSSVETITLEPRSSRTLSYTVRDTSAAVYLVVPELLTEGARSLTHIRFVRTEVDMLRLNFPAVADYPLGGSSAQVFACLHNAGLAASVPDGELTLTVKDRFGRPIHQHQYRGVVTGAMMGELSEFFSLFTHKTFSVEAILSQNGKVVDSGTIHYRCEALNGEQCWTDYVINPIPLGVLALLVGAGLWYGALRVRNRSSI